MSRDIYVEPGRKMKSAGEQGQIESVELMRPMIGENGEVEHENDLTEAEFDVAVEVGPSSSSKRAATVRALTSMMAVTQDPDAMRVLQAAALMNMEGEGLADIRDHFRRQLVQMGVIKPTDEEAQQMQAAGQQQDPNAVFLQAAAEEAMAKAAKANADVVKTIAESELTQAKTAETLMKIDGGGDAPSMNQGGQMQAAPMRAEPPMMSERERLELEAMMIENAIRSRQLEEQEATLARVQEELAASQTQNTTSADMQQMVETLRERVGMIDETVARIGDAITEMAGVMRENADRAIAQISRPKRIVRERGRIARIEVE
jgi:hypothetical protein